MAKVGVTPAGIAPAACDDAAKIEEFFARSASGARVAV
eukprot:COSAG06_NODE_41084_length_395_cov_0.861486_1_plen_37_part_01